VCLYRVAVVAAEPELPEDPVHAVIEIKALAFPEQHLDDSRQPRRRQGAPRLAHHLAARSQWQRGPQRRDALEVAAERRHGEARGRVTGEPELKASVGSAPCSGICCSKLGISAGGAPNLGDRSCMADW